MNDLNTTSIKTELASDEAGNATLTALACDIATGAVKPPEDIIGMSIRGGHKDLNAKGRGPWWYRMVLRNGAWTYFCEDRLPMGTFLAGDRRCSVRGDVYLGEVVAQHDKGGPVDAMYLIAPNVADNNMLCPVPFRKRKDGKFVVTLPDGREVVVSNPRK